MTDLITRNITIDGLIASFQPGEKLFLAGSAGEAVGVTTALFAAPELTAGLDLTLSFVPGVNPLPIERLDASVRVTGLFMQPNLTAAQVTGKFRHLPISYAGFVKHIRERLSIDTCVVQVSPPDSAGLCSLGPAVEFIPSVLKKSRRVVAVVNPQVPRMPGSLSLPWASFDQVCESDAPLRCYDPGSPSAEASQIARGIAAFVGDGATLQLGLGKVPAALLDQLHDRRGLRIDSGMVSDAIMPLAAVGALDPDTPMRVCVVIGSDALYRWQAERPGLIVAGCEVTHDQARLMAVDGLIAVNAALEVDLFGQANLEFADGRARSGAGGAPDFARAASMARNGVSIVALPATLERGTRSRIVPRLGSDAVVTLPRDVVDIVITEHGTADLRGKSVHERAEVLIEIAAPVFRSALADQWREMKARI